MAGKNGNNEEKTTLVPSQFQNVFRSEHSSQAIDYLLRPGDNLNDFSMRADIPERNTEAIVRATAMAVFITNCREYHNKAFEDMAMLTMGLWTSREGKRIDLAVRAIIGSYGDNTNKGSMSFTERVKRAAKKPEAESNEG